MSVYSVFKYEYSRRPCLNDVHYCYAFSQLLQQICLLYPLSYYRKSSIMFTVHENGSFSSDYLMDFKILTLMFVVKRLKAVYLVKLNYLDILKTVTCLGYCWCYIGFFLIFILL